MTFSSDQAIESLYIHWPFCPYKCHYCPFVALAAHEAYMHEYHHALKKEIVQFSQIHSQQKIRTIFFGGGTPSTYPEDLLLDMFDTLYSRYLFYPQHEISLEVNPGTVTPEKIDIWKQVGINRLSVGVQSLDDAVLSKLNRHQKAADVFQFMEWAPGSIENISVDLIIGLPGITTEQWKKLVQTIVFLPIKHISIYMLMVHEDTPLYFGVRSQRIILPPDEEVLESYMWSIEFLEKQGFEQYEISNFAKSGYQSMHNNAYWQRTPYKGFGLGACSFDGFSRFQNDKNLMNYLATMKKQTDSTYADCTVFSELLSPEQVWLEELMLGIRQTKGVLLETLKNKLLPEQQRVFENKITDCVKAGLLDFDTKIVKLTPRGRALEHEIIARLA